MGLFRKITDNFYLPTEEHKGLLGLAKRVLDSDSSNLPPAEKLLKNNDLYALSTLVLEDNVFQTLFSCGLKSSSFDAALSTADFWNGTFAADNQVWYRFSGDELSPYYQLFSESDKHYINTLFICRFLHNDKACIALVASEKEKTSLPDDFLQTLVSLSFETDQL